MREIGRTAGLQAGILVVCVALAWGVELVDRVAFGGSLERSGIRPRSVAGLWGILAAPLLHVGWLHLAANTLPFVVLGWLVMLRRVSDFVVVTLASMMIGGLGVWLIGPGDSVTVGASGVIFGYLGYLVARGYFERSVWAIVLAVVALLLYGGVLWGVLPGQSGVSWQGHLFGFIGGVVAARVLVASKPRAIAAGAAVRRTA